jgi:hypothetical protein
LLASRQLVDLWTTRRQLGAGDAGATTAVAREGVVSRRAGKLWRSALDAAAAAAADAPADRRHDREQAQQLLRLRLEQLHERQAAPIGAAGDGVHRKPQQRQPAWSLEAAEVLCSVGMAPEQAALALLAAHKFALRRNQHAQRAAGGSRDGEEAGSGDAAAPAGLPPPLGAAHVEAVCRELLDTARVPTLLLRRVLAEAPQLLACSPAELRKQVKGWVGVLRLWGKGAARLCRACQRSDCRLCPTLSPSASSVPCCSMKPWRRCGARGGVWLPPFRPSPPC